MYKAIRRDTGREIIILEPSWSDEVDTLRTWDQEDLLVCQECKQPVRVRAGDIRAWHFAHKHLRNCPIGHESPELLQARALLYRWLVSKFGSERVTLEKLLKKGGLPRPVDCWVEGDQPFAYWIFNAAVRPDSRDTLSLALSMDNIIAHWLFLASMLRREPDKQQHVYLTTTEREFMHRTDYDVPVSRNGRSLHYLDHETGEFTTYRGLYPVHEPQEFAGAFLIHPLDEMLAFPKTGEFVHPEEHERLQAYRAEQKKREEEVNAKMQADAARRNARPPSHKQQAPAFLYRPPTRPSAHVSDTPQTSRELIIPPLDSSPERPYRVAKPLPDPVTQPENPPKKPVPPLGICTYCGERTRNWIEYDEKTGMCICKSCSRGPLFSRSEE